MAAHMIGRAAYFVGVPLWEETIVDELQGHYDRASAYAQSMPPGRGAAPTTLMDMLAPSRTHYRGTAAAYPNPQRSPRLHQAGAHLTGAPSDLRPELLMRV